MLAYFDGLRGLVPVKVIHAAPDADGRGGYVVHGRVTVDMSDRGYPRGSLIESTGVRMVPRDNIRGRYRNRILPYSWAGIII